MIQPISSRILKNIIHYSLLWSILVPASGHTLARKLRPDLDSVPTRVSVGIHIINVTKINDIEQTFTVDLAVRMSWQDQRLGGKPGTYELSDVWHPAVTILNQRGISKLFDDVVRVDKDGNVRYVQRLYGDFGQRFPVHNFPFDRQNLQITVASRYYTPKEIQFIMDEINTSIANELEITGWVLDREIGFIPSAYRIGGSETELSQAAFRISASREAGFYIWRVIVPLLLIVFMSWTVFFIDPNHLEAQITVSATSILTVIALQFTFAEILPKVSYLTRLDKFIQGATILIFLALIESITTSAFTIGGKHALARKFDKWSRVVFPAALILLIVFSFLL